MIRFYKLYSLFLKTMANANTTNIAFVKEWCLCEKLPRAVLHIPLDCNLRCEVCGLERRPKTDPSSSDEEEAAANKRQKMLLERRRSAEALQGAARVKVAMRAKKPCLMHNCKKNCSKCGGMPKPRAKHETVVGECKKKVYSGCFGHFPKPMGVLPKWRRGVRTPDRDPTPTAAPPSSPSSPQSVQHTFGSMWERAPEESTNLVAMAREVFIQPCQSSRRLWPTNGKRLVSDYIPLSTPITNPSGGAISKRSSIFRTSTSRTLPPLSKVLASVLVEKGASKARAKGGGLSNDSINADNQMESQFCPFEYYEGPSEDALVLDSARFMLQEPMALNTKTDRHLPLLLLPSSGSEESVSSGSLIHDDIATVTSSDSRNSGDISGICKIGYEHPIPQKTINLLDFEEAGVKAEKKTDHVEKQTLKMLIVDQGEQMMKALGLSSTGHVKVTNLMNIDQEDGAAENGELESESNGSANPPINDVTNEHVISSNKYQTDAKYSKVLSKKLSRPHILHVPGDRLCRTTGRKREGAKPVCDKCGHHRNAADAVMPTQDSKAKSVQQTPRKYQKKVSGSYREIIKMPLSKNLFGIQPSVSVPDKTGTLHRTLHSFPRFLIAEQKLEGRKPTCIKNIKEDKPNPLGDNNLNTPMKCDEESPKKYHNLSMYKEPSSSSQTVADHDPAFFESLPVPLTIKYSEEIVKNVNSNQPYQHHVTHVSKAASDQRQLRNSFSEDSSLEEKFHKTPDGYVPTDGRTNQSHILSHSCIKTEVSIHWRGIHTLETVSHVCGEMIKPKMATHKCNVMENLKKTTLSDQPTNVAIYEFRMPDINSNAIDKSGMANSYRRNKDVSTSGSETPVAHSPTPRHMNLFSRKFKRIWRRSPPIFAVPSIKYNRRKLRTKDGLCEVTELSLMANPDILMQHKEDVVQYGNIPSKADHLEVKIGRRIRREHSLERRFNMLVKTKSNPSKTNSEEEQHREYLLKVKLEEMTTKPIQLLTPHEETSDHSSTRLYQDPLRFIHSS
ncbi:uncharacterized protein LOC111074150 [Drosophila obscura]|uniref:uncharacterized protein LOC111074150 n=1 Tax=Drosophila obscura TaxID=7282 RepID=UPI001BB2CB0A|nr:uncharacterized protein LOC111074150 [Drosophila obscura]